MENRMIIDLLMQDSMILHGQPKWTFGKNTCNTYEVYVSAFRHPDGSQMPSWPILQAVEQDDVATILFSSSFLLEAVHRTVDVSMRANSNLTLSLNLLPRFAESDKFVGLVEKCLTETGLEAKRLQFEVSELQDLNADGCEHLNTVHDKLGIGLVMGNFGTPHTNMPLLHRVHFDMLELDKSYAALVPDDVMACRTVVAIQHMADTLDIKLCAKGIENQEQFEFFEEIGTFKGQGDLIGSPMSMEDLEQYVRQYALEKGHK